MADWGCGGAVRCDFNGTADLISGQGGDLRRRRVRSDTGLVEGLGVKELPTDLARDASE